MELLKIVRKRSFLSEAAYVVLNILLAIALLVAVLTVREPWLAIGIVLLSKWRVFAVRSRYWIANVRANMIDTIVGVSTVLFLYQAADQLAVQIVLTILYAAWLLFVKPQSKRSYVALQAFVGQVVGITAIAQVSPSFPASLVVLLAWMVSYSAARHILSIQHETHINFLSLLWGFFIAELMWLTYHWTIGYVVVGSLQLPQVAVIVALLSFLSERFYASFRRHGQVQMGDILLPALLSVSVIVVLLAGFTGISTI